MLILGSDWRKILGVLSAFEILLCRAGFYRRAHLGRLRQRRH